MTKISTLKAELDHHIREMEKADKLTLSSNPFESSMAEQERSHRGNAVNKCIAEILLSVPQSYDEVLILNGVLRSFSEDIEYATQSSCLYKLV